MARQYVIVQATRLFSTSPESGMAIFVDDNGKPFKSYEAAAERVKLAFSVSDFNPGDYVEIVPINTIA